MKKNGFTLAEALIALGIVGIIAALALPMFNKTKPDPVKVAYLRTYDSIVSATSSLAKNEKLYPLQYTGSAETRYDKLNSNATFYDYPFFNTMATKDVAAGISLSVGSRKLCDALFYSFGGDKNSCKVDPIAEYKDADFKPSFTTKDGTEFMVSTKTSYKPVEGAEPYKSGLYETSIYFDVDGAKGNNCIYNQNTCTLPDRFKVFVLADGTVKAGDAMGKGYLKTRNLLNRISMVGKLGDIDVDINTGDAAIINKENFCDESEGVLNGQECKPCDPGYHAENGVCVETPCDEGSVRENGVCVTCASKGQAWDGANGCMDCPDGTVVDGLGCRSCGMDSKVWDSATKSCKSCQSPLVYKNGTCECKGAVVNGVCTGCDPDEKPGDGIMGVLSYECSGSRWYPVCDIGYTPSGNGCMPNNNCSPLTKPGNDYVCINGQWVYNLTQENINNNCGAKLAYTPPNGTGWECVGGSWQPICNFGYVRISGQCQKQTNTNPINNGLQTGNGLILNTGGTTTGGTSGGSTWNTTSGDYDNTAALDIQNCVGAQCGNNATTGNFVTGTGATTSQITGGSTVTGVVNRQWAN